VVLALVTGVDDDRSTVIAQRENAEKLTRAAGLHVLPDRASWVAAQDPHRDTVAALTAA
jgi:hypothetical protein